MLHGILAAALSTLNSLKLRPGSRTLRDPIPIHLAPRDRSSSRRPAGRPVPGRPHRPGPAVSAMAVELIEATTDRPPRGRPRGGSRLAYCQAFDRTRGLGWRASRPGQSRQPCIRVGPGSLTPPSGVLGLAHFRRRLRQVSVPTDNSGSSTATRPARPGTTHDVLVGKSRRVDRRMTPERLGPAPNSRHAGRSPTGKGASRSTAGGIRTHTSRRTMPFEGIVSTVPPPPRGGPSLGGRPDRRQRRRRPSARDTGSRAIDGRDRRTPPSLGYDYSRTRASSSSARTAGATRMPSGSSPRSGNRWIVSPARAAISWPAARSQSLRPRS
jgi:hypothetical protein